MRYYFLTYVAKGADPGDVDVKPMFGFGLSSIEVSVTGNCFCKMDGPVVLSKVKKGLESSGLSKVVFTSFTELDEETFLANNPVV